MQKEDVNNLRVYYLDGNGDFFLDTKKKGKFRTFFSCITTTQLLRRRGR